jgi:hypothetical protein
VLFLTCFSCYNCISALTYDLVVETQCQQEDHSNQEQEFLLSGTSKLFFQLKKCTNCLPLLPSHQGQWVCHFFLIKFVNKNIIHVEFCHEMFDDHDFLLKNVKYNPELKWNLIFVSTFDDLEYCTRILTWYNENFS